jgi:hypothetical protein
MNLLSSLNSNPVWGSGTVAASPNIFGAGWKALFLFYEVTNVSCTDFFKIGDITILPSLKACPVSWYRHGRCSIPPPCIWRPGERLYSRRNGLAAVNRPGESNQSAKFSFLATSPRRSKVQAVLGEVYSQGRSLSRALRRTNIRSQGFRDG